VEMTILGGGKGGEQKTRGQKELDERGYIKGPL